MPDGASDWVDPDDPEFIDFAERVINELVPKIDDSVATVSLLPTSGAADIKFAVELGISMMLDKPLIMVIPPGAQVPYHIVRAADAIVEFGPHAQQGIHEALDRLFNEDGTLKNPPH